MMGSCGGAALLCSLIIVGSGVASLLASTAAAVTSSHRAEGGERVTGNLDVCENRLMFARLPAAAAFCPRIDEFKDPVVKVQHSAPYEPPTLTSAGSVATTKAAAEANCNHRSFLQSILSRLLGRYRDMMPFRNSTAQDVGYRRVVVVMVTAGAIIAGLLIPYLVITNRKKRKLSGNESMDKRSHVGDCGWVSDSIQERQHLLLSATQSDPVDTRPSDAKNGPSNRHPQFAMPMSKPVLLREQCGNKDSVVGAKQHQQPRRLEEELAFGEIQWTQAPDNSNPPLTTSTPNNPPAVRTQRFAARQRGQRSFKFPAGAASNLELRKKIATSNVFNGSFNSVLPPSEETSVVDGDESMDLYNTAEEGVAEDITMNPTALAPIKERTPNAMVNERLQQDDQQSEVLQGDSHATDQQWATAEETNKISYAEEVVEENQGEDATAWGNEDVDNQEQQCDAVADETVYENLEWVANDEEDPDNWLEEKIEEGNEENANKGDFVTDDAVEEGDSVGWTQEHEAVSGQIENEPGEEETTQEYGIPEEEAWNTVAAADDQMEEDQATQDDGVPDEEAWNTVLATDDQMVEEEVTQDECVSADEAVADNGEEWTDNVNAGKNNTDGKNDKITTEAEEQEELRDVITSDALEDLEDIYVDDDDLNESNPNMMLIRRNSEADDDDNLGEMIGFPRVPLLPDHESILSMDIPSTGPTSLRSNCTDPTDTEEDDEACGGTGGATDEKVAVSAKAVTTAAAAKRRADTFAQLTSKEELSQAKLILVNDRA